MAIGGLLNQYFLHLRKCLVSMSHHTKEKGIITFMTTSLEFGDAVSQNLGTIPSTG